MDTALDPAWNASIAYRQAMQPAPAPRRATPAEAFEAARDLFRRGERLDMVALAESLGVARATLYRWTGDRDQLLADVISAELVGLAAYVERTAEGLGRRALEQAISNYLEIIAGSPALHAFIANEGQSGLRLLTSPRGPIRPRLVQTMAGAIERQVQAGHYRPPAPPQTLADGIVSLGERYLHNGGDPSLNPDPATARTIVGLLLREDQ